VVIRNIYITPYYASRRWRYGDNDDGRARPRGGRAVGTAAGHDVLLTREADVLREMRAFVAGLPSRR